MTNERLGLRSTEIPLEERLDMFDQIYRPDEIDSVYVEKEDKSVSRYTAYAIPMDVKGATPILTKFLLDAASVGDTVWTTLKIDHSEDARSFKENLIVLERQLWPKQKAYEPLDVDLS